MVDTVKISDLPAVVTADGTSVVPCVQGGVTKKETNAQVISGAGSVVGPSSATDNAVARYDGITGKLIQNSLTTIDDNGKLSTDTINVANTSASAGGIKFNGVNYLSNYGTRNTFGGAGAGNTTLTTASATDLTAFGYESLLSVTTGQSIATFGTRAGNAITTALNCAIFGAYAGQKITVNGGHAIFGDGACANAITSSVLTAFGNGAGSNYTGGESYNIILGPNGGVVGESNTIRIGDGTNYTKVFIDRTFHNFGTRNSFGGESSGNITLTTGSAQNNAAFGYLTLNAITTASNTAAFGSNCLKALTTGINNSGFGNSALGLCTTGGGNSAFGRGALSGITTGGSNIGVGVSAGSNYTGAETGNICIGSSGTLGESNVINIGSAQTVCNIAGINGATIASYGVVVCDNGISNQLGTVAILPSTVGGTGNGFTKFSGPASSEKTFTLPNASDTIACRGIANTFTKAQSVTPVSVTSSSNSIATDASLSNIFTHTLTENTTLANPTNLVSGTYYTWIFTQAASAKTLAFGNLFKFPGGSAMVVSTGNGAVDTMTALYNGTSLLTTFNQAFA